MKDEATLIKEFAIAAKVVDRAERGIPQDRWIRGDHEMEAFVKCYINLVDAVGFLKKEFNPLSDFNISRRLSTCSSVLLSVLSSWHKENKAIAYLADGFEFISLISCKLVTFY